MTTKISEFLWDYNQNVFWDFVNSSKALSTAASSDQGKFPLIMSLLLIVAMLKIDVYELAIDIVEELLPSSIYNIFLFSLSLHTYSPAVQLFHQV